MFGLEKLPIPADEMQKLPLGFRVIFYKEVSENDEKSGVYEITGYGSGVVPTRRDVKLISRT